MKCKYWDAGWCYAPENVETNATQGGCFEPEYCPYTKQMTNPNKTIKDSDQYSKITFNYPIDDEIVMINGVKYQRVEEPKLPTLLDIIREWNDNEDYPTCEELVNRIEEWMPAEVIEDGEDYNNGWNDCLKEILRNLK